MRALDRVAAAFERVAASLRHWNQAVLGSAICRVRGHRMRGGQPHPWQFEHCERCMLVRRWAPVEGGSDEAAGAELAMQRLLRVAARVEGVEIVGNAFAASTEAPDDTGESGPPTF